LRPAEAISKDGATLAVQPDGVIVLSGKAPPEDTYIVTLTLAAGTSKVAFTMWPAAA
jgi:hypothetical protein